MVNIYQDLVIAIIKEQELVMGPLAWSEANKVKGMVVKDHDIKIKGEGKQVLESLVNQYGNLFGRASIEVCRDAVKKIASTADGVQLPKVLV